MNSKAKKAKRQATIENQAINLLSKEEINKKIELIEKILNHQPGETWKPEENLIKTINSLLSQMTCL